MSGRSGTSAAFLLEDVWQARLAVSYPVDEQHRLARVIEEMWAELIRKAPTPVHG
jgi:hypothetical protein